LGFQRERASFLLFDMQQDIFFETSEIMFLPLKKPSSGPEKTLIVSIPINYKINNTPFPLTREAVVTVDLIGSLQRKHPVFCVSSSRKKALCKLF